MARYEVRRDLYSTKLEFRGVGDSLNEQCIGQAGYADEQGVNTTYKRRSYFVDDRPLINNASAY
jgi:hypothetical protein